MKKRNEQIRKTLNILQNMLKEDKEMFNYSDLNWDSPTFFFDDKNQIILQLRIRPKYSLGIAYTESVNILLDEDEYQDFKYYLEVYPDIDGLFFEYKRIILKFLLKHLYEAFLHTRLGGYYNGYLNTHLVYDFWSENLLCVMTDIKTNEATILGKIDGCKYIGISETFEQELQRVISKEKREDV
jgi:hypothetical protein